VYKSFGIKSLDNFYKLMQNIQQEQYGYLETQANKFASYLLIPRNELIIEKNKFIEKLKKQNSVISNMIISKKIDDKTLNSYIAIPVSKKFGVSDDAMEIALNDIDLNGV
jgi:Zn-dependent peptidase ImmA (M78 family)